MKKRNIFFLIPVALLSLTSCFGITINKPNTNEQPQVPSEPDVNKPSDSEEGNKPDNNPSPDDETNTNPEGGNTTPDSGDSSPNDAEENQPGGNTSPDTGETTDPSQGGGTEGETTDPNQGVDTEDESNKEPEPLGPDDPIDISLENINVEGVIPSPKALIQLVDYEKVNNMTPENLQLLKDAVHNTLTTHHLTQYKEENEGYSYTLNEGKTEVLSEYSKTCTTYSLCGDYINREESYQNIRQKGQTSINGSAKYHLDEYFSKITDGFSYLSTSNIDYCYPNNHTLLPIKNNIKHVFSKEELTPTLLTYINSLLTTYPEACNRQSRAVKEPFNNLAIYNQVTKNDGSYINIKVDGKDIYLNVFYTQTNNTKHYTNFETYEIKNGIYTGFLIQKQILNSEGKCINHSYQKVSLLYDDLINKPLPSDISTYIDYTSEDVSSLRLLRDVMYNPFNPLYNDLEVNLDLYEKVELPYNFFLDIKDEYLTRQYDLEEMGMRRTSHEVSYYTYNEEYTNKPIHQDNYIFDDTLIVGKTAIDYLGKGFEISSKLNLTNPQYNFNSTAYRETHTLDKANKVIDFVSTKTGTFKMDYETSTLNEGNYHYSISFQNQRKEYNFLTHNMENYSLLSRTASIFRNLETSFKSYNADYPMIFAYQSKYDDTKIIQEKGPNSYLYVFRNGIIEARAGMGYERSYKDEIIDGINCKVKGISSFIEYYEVYNEPVIPDIVDETYVEIDNFKYNMSKSSIYAFANY